MATPKYPRSIPITHPLTVQQLGEICRVLPAGTLVTRAEELVLDEHGLRIVTEKPPKATVAPDPPKPVRKHKARIEGDTA